MATIQISGVLVFLSMQKNNYLYSVVISTFNRQTYLDELLESIFNQTVPPYEVIVIEAGQNQSFKSLKAKLQGTKNVRLFHLQGCSLGASRNQGVKLAKSQYIFFSDDDDIWQPRKAEVSLGLLLKNDVVSHRVNTFPTNRLIGNSIKRSSHMIIRNFWSNVYGGGSSLACRKGAALTIKFDEKMSSTEDIEWILRCVFAGLSMGFSDEILCSYRSNSSNKMGTSIKRNIKGELYFLKKFSIIFYIIGFGLVLKIFRNLFRLILSR